MCSLPIESSNCISATLSYPKIRKNEKMVRLDASFFVSINNNKKVPQIA